MRNYLGKINYTIYLSFRARARAHGADSSVDFFSLLSNEQLRFKQQALNQHVKPAKPPQKEKKKKEQSEQPKPKVPKADWLPRAEYLKKLANDRKAAATASAAAAAAAAAPAGRSPSRRRSSRRSNKRSRSPERKNPKNKKRR